jgi:hypothetical protein
VWQADDFDETVVLLFREWLRFSNQCQRQRLYDPFFHSRRDAHLVVVANFRDLIEQVGAWGRGGNSLL